MISLRLRLSPDSTPLLLTVCGHEKTRGSDFASCNAVSALVQTYWQSIVCLIGAEAVVVSDDGQSFVLQKNAQRQLKDKEAFIWSVLTKSFLIGIQGVQKASESVILEVENLAKE